MEKFWAVILIFAIVAAGGLLYVNQVYAPQKDAQVAMADTANQTLTAVRSDVEDTAPITVSALNVINTVNMYCKVGNKVTIHVGNNDYIESSNGIENQVDDFSEYYIKKVTKTNGIINRIDFTVIN